MESHCIPRVIEEEGVARGKQQSERKNEMVSDGVENEAVGFCDFGNGGVVMMNNESATIQFGLQ